MTVIQRHIAKTILTSTILVILVLLSLYTFMDFIAELDDLGKGNYVISSVMTYIGLTMPERLYELLPIAALLGSVLGLGQLASQSELVVMRASGMSIGKISRAVMVVAVILMIIGIFLGEVVRPISVTKANAIQSLAIGTASKTGDKGFWSRNGMHFNHIGKVNQDGSFSDIQIYEFDLIKQLRVITHANKAVYDEKSWLLQGVTQSLISEKGVKVKTIEQARWHSDVNPELVDVVAVAPDLLPVWDLLKYIDYLEMNQQAVTKYHIAFWKKLIMPISTAVMVMLAIPFVFGPLRSAPIGGRIVFGALAGIAFNLLNQSFQHMGVVFDVAPFLAASLPTLVFSVLGVYLIKKID